MFDAGDRLRAGSVLGQAACAAQDAAVGVGGIVAPNRQRNRRRGSGVIGKRQVAAAREAAERKGFGRHREIEDNARAAGGQGAVLQGQAVGQAQGSGADGGAAAVGVGSAEGGDACAAVVDSHDQRPARTPVAEGGVERRAARPRIGEGQSRVLPVVAVPVRDVPLTVKRLPELLV